MAKSSSERLNEEDIKLVREETFQKWLQDKKEDQIRKRDKAKLLKLMALEQEQIRKETAELSFLLWKHKKDQQRKAKEMEELQRKQEEEMRLRLKRQASEERMSQWLNTSRQRPRPIPSSMGLLSLTATNPPSFYNPYPWSGPVS